MPLGHADNANIAMVTVFSCHEDADEARRRGLDGFRFFGYGLGHHYIFGEHRPGRTNIWERFEQARDQMSSRMSGGIGTPEQISAHLAKFASQGVDQVIFIQQGGRNRHDHICQSLELFADKVMPRFHAAEAEREAAKAKQLAPYIEAALARKQWMRPLDEDEIPTIVALGRQIAQQDVKEMSSDGKTADFGRGDLNIPLQDPAAKAKAAADD